MRTFRYAIQLEPNFPDAYNNLGNALRESGQLEVIGSVVAGVHSVGVSRCTRRASFYVLSTVDPEIVRPFS